MSDPITMAKKARESLANGLGALQSDPAIPAELRDLAAPIAQAMGALHQLEKSGGANLAGHSEAALGHVRTALAQLQVTPPSHPSVAQALEAVAASLGLVHALHKMSQEPAPAAVPSPVGGGTPIARVALQPVVQPAPRPSPQPQPQPVAATPKSPPPPDGMLIAPMPARGPTGTHVQPPPAQQAPVQQPPVQQPPVQQAPAFNALTTAPMPPTGAVAQMVAQAQQQHAAPPPQEQPPQQQWAAGPPSPAMPFAPTLQMHADPFNVAPPPVAPVPDPSGGTAVPIAADLGAHSPTNFYKGLSGNDVIDHGGIFVSTYMVPKMGTHVRLKVSLPGGYEFEAGGLVKWVRETGEGSDAPPGFGAKFTQITPEARQLVYRYVRNREPLFHDDM